MEGPCRLQTMMMLCESLVTQDARYRWKRLRREFEPSYLGRHQCPEQHLGKLCRRVGARASQSDVSLISRKCKTAWLEEMVEEKQEMELDLVFFGTIASAPIASDCASPPPPQCHVRSCQVM